MSAHGAPSPPDVYGIACLTGGTDRMVDAALVALVQSGRLCITAPGELATASLVRRHPVEAAVLDAVGPAGARSVETVRWRLTTDDRVLEVPRRLRDDGLLGGIPGPRGRHSSWRLVPTYAGRHLLHELRDARPVDAIAGGTEAMTVALHGRQHMADAALCAAIFEQPRRALAHGVGPHPPSGLDFADGPVAAKRIRADIVARAHRFQLGGP